MDCGVAGEGVAGAGPRDLSKGPMDLPPKKGDEGNRGLSKSELVDMFEKFVQKMPTGVSFFYVEFFGVGSKTQSKWGWAGKREECGAGRQGDVDGSVALR